MKRVLSILCVIAMLFGMLIIPTSATQEQSDPSGVADNTAEKIVLSENKENLEIRVDTYIDLNGCNIAGITVANGATAYISDSKTDDYTVEDEVYGVVTGIAGAVEAAEGYLQVEEQGSRSFHRVDLQIRSMALRPGVAGVYYTSNFAGDEVVARQVVSYGIALSVVAEPTAENMNTLCGYSTITDFAPGTNLANGTLLRGIMKTTNTAEKNAAYAAMPVYGRAYLKTASGFVFGECVSRNLQEQVEQIDEIFEDLTEIQRTGILDMYASYTEAMSNWEIPNIRAEVLGDNVIKVPVESENGVVSETVTVEEGDISVTIPSGTLLEEGVTEVTLTVTKKETSDSGIEAGEGQTLTPMDVHVEGVSPNNTVPLTVYLGKVMPENLNMGNYSIYHVEADGAKEMTLVANDQEFTAHNQYKYTLDGELTLSMATFSEVTLASEEPVWEGGVDHSWYQQETNELYIRNADQLWSFCQIVGGMAQDIAQDDFAGKTIHLLADIDLGDQEEEGNSLLFYPIGYYNEAMSYIKPTDGTATAANVSSFSGTFNGNGHTIANFYQNTWQMWGNYDGNNYKAAMGLFGYVKDGTVKNLTVENFSSDGEFTPTGVIAAYAVNSTFENIAITNCNPRVYNTGNGGIVGIGGNSDDPDNYKLTFNNITIDNSNKITALWGSWDVACGGLVGMFRGDGHVHMTNCHVAAQIDVYNDVCGNYQYYWYRYSGMLVGTNKNMTTDANGYTVPETDKFHATNCTVHFGDWNDYYYCELVANSLASYTHDHQFSRLEVIDSLDEIKSDDTWTKAGNFLLFGENGKQKVSGEGTCYHIMKDANGNLYEHKHDAADATNNEINEVVNGETVLKENNQRIYLPFNQLFTGYGWGVKHIPIHKNGGPFSGVTILDDTANSIVKFDSILPATLAQAENNLVIAENTVLSIDQIFQDKTGINEKKSINSASVQIFVSPADESSTVQCVTLQGNSDSWNSGTIQFKGRGAATITITDYFYCTPTVIHITVGSVNDAAKAMIFAGTTPVNAVCPHCASKSEETAALQSWEALPETAESYKDEQHHHFYLATTRDYKNNTTFYGFSNPNGTTATASGTPGCINLNKQIIASTGRAFFTQGKNSVLTLMGDGTVRGGAVLTNSRNGLLDMTGPLNLYGGTYISESSLCAALSMRGSNPFCIANIYEDVRIERPANDTPGLNIWITDGSSVNLYGGVIQGCNNTATEHVGTVYGGNIMLKANASNKSYTCALNVYGGTITGGEFSNGGNIYVLGNTNANPKATVNIYGGNITDGDVYATGGNAAVNLSGAPVVDELDVTGGVLPTVGQMSDGARVTLTTGNVEIVSNPISDDIPYTAYGKYFFATEEGRDVTVQDNVLKVVTVDLCPCCDVYKEDIQWIELTNETLASIRIRCSNDKSYYLPSGHYKLVEDITYDGQLMIGDYGGTQTSDVIMDLNGHTIESPVNRCMYLINQGTTLTIVDFSESQAGCVNGKFNAGGGVLYAGSGTTINMYAGRVKGTGNPYVGGAIYVLGTFNLFGGTIVGDDVTKTDGSHRGGAAYINGGTLNVYGGELTNGIADEGDCVYANNTCTLNFYGGEIGEVTYGSTSTAITVGGNTRIEALNLLKDKKITIDNLQEGAMIRVNTVGVFTEPNCAEYQNYFNTAIGNTYVVGVTEDGALTTVGDGRLSVGFGRVSILPEVHGVQIAGGDASARLSEDSRDELATTCIAIKEGNKTILLYTIDLITVDEKVYGAQAAISEATGVPVEDILLNCTHTHSGVSIRTKWTVKNEEGVDCYSRDQYQEMFYKACARAGEAAIIDLSPAVMYYGSVQTQNMVFVRHYLLENGETYGNGHGTTYGTSITEHLYDSDGELQVIKFARAAEDKKDVVLMNLGAHATMMNSIAANTISADWPYNARSYVEYEIGEDGMPDITKPRDYLCAVFEAAAGDQIPTSKIPGLAPYGNKYPEFGNKIGEYCLGVLDDTMTKADGYGIQLNVYDYTAPTMKEGTENTDLVDKAREVRVLANQLGSSHANVVALYKEYGFTSYYEASGLYSRSVYPETYTMELHTMTINGVAFIFAPYEMFGEQGTYIKEHAGDAGFDMTFVVTCSENAHGYHMGYLPNVLGCEESFYEYDVTKFERGTAEDLAVTYVQLLTEMKNS